MATQEGFLEEVTFELTSKEQAGHREGLEEFQQRECQCKGPEVGESLVCLNRQEGKQGAQESGRGESEGLGTHHLRPCWHLSVTRSRLRGAKRNGEWTEHACVGETVEEALDSSRAHISSSSDLNN